jgi:hypothetical protein
MQIVAAILKEHIAKGYTIVFMDDISIYWHLAEKHKLYIRAVLEKTTLNLRIRCINLVIRKLNLLVTKLIKRESNF